MERLGQSDAVESGQKKKQKMLSQEEIKRYSRQIVLPEIGMEGQEKLKNAKVLVIGAGGLGCPVLQYLAAAGIGTIGIVDDDVVDESNLQRQILYVFEDIGLSKAITAAKKLSTQNPNVNYQIWNTRLQKENALDLISQYDLVVDGSDNFPTRYLVNDACVILKKPFVFGSIYKFEGQLSVFNYKEGPTYRCLFPVPPEDSQNCSEIGVMGALPGIIGTLQANEVIKIVTGIGEVLSGKLLLVDALDLTFRSIKFMRVEDNSKINKLSDYELMCETPVKEISAKKLKEKLDNKEDIQLIDVREEYEYSTYNIKGESIPLKSIVENRHKISKSKQVIVHCQQGGRSTMAIKLLQEKYNFQNLFNLSGGLNAFQQ